MTFGAGLLLALPLLAAPKYTLSLGARAEGDVRWPGDPTLAGAPTDHSFDATTDAAARLAIDLKRVHFGIAYLPRLVLTDLGGHPGRDLLHVAEASAGWSFRRGRLLLTERASYGTRSFSALVTPSPDPTTGLLPVQSAPQGLSVRYVSSDTLLTSELRTSARTTLTTGVGYLISGSADEASRNYVPLARGPRASVALDVVVSHRDDFVTTVDGTELTTEFSSQPSVRSDIVRATEAWRRAWGPRTNSQIGGGVAIVPENGAGQARVYPSGGASFHQGVPTGPGAGLLDLTLTAGVDAVIDRLTGLVDERAIGTLLSTWTLAPLTLRAIAGASESLDRSNPNALRLVFGEAGARFQLSKPFALDFGARVFDQTATSTTAATTALAAASGRRWVGFVALVFQGPPISL